MSAQILKNQIIVWLRTCDYWLQYAGNRFLEGENTSTELVDNTYKFFKEDNKLKPLEERPIISFNEIITETEVNVDNLELKSVKNVENVNALAIGQEINIHSSLTIIYGGNGAGKSGYVRLLNNAFNSRGDKIILSNVFNQRAGDPRCIFNFQSNENNYDLIYPEHKEKSEFSKFSVFDTHSIKTHLEQDNRLNFTPSGFEFFEKILELYELLKQKLLAEINSKNLRNNFTQHFLNDNQIKTIITSLGANSNKSQLESLAVFTDTDRSTMEGLIVKKETLKALDISKKIDELQNINSQIIDFINNQKTIFDCLKQSDIEEYSNAINSFHHFQSLAKANGIQKFESYNIDQLGTNEWRSFIKASRDYTSLIEKNRMDISYPREKDKCLFCLRPLTEAENTLLKSYWDLLNSQAETQLNLIVQSLRDKERKLNSQNFRKFDESMTYFQYVHFKDEKLANRWKKISIDSENTIKNIFTNLKNRNFELQMNYFSESLDEFNVVLSVLKNEIQDLINGNPALEIDALEKQIQLLTDKSLLSQLLEQVLIFIDNHKWVEKARASLSSLNTRQITIKQGEFFNSHITEKYTNTFNTECSKINAPKIVNIVQRNERISTLRKLQIAGVVANKVLSEGEQRAISLADFLTEVQLNENNKGVFFDDPITSQDHIRRELIAKRLVELASQKQVIVFTHDIAFFLSLKVFAERLEVGYAFTTIRNHGGSAGIINSELPWVAQNVKSRIGTLKNRLVHLKKVEREQTADEYFFAAKTWYVLLREAWERAVEERLFKGVVERFSVGVQTQKLRKVVVTEELLSAIDHGMTESSNWVHDAAAGLNPTIPDTKKAESDLKFFEEFAAKCQTS